MLSLDAQGLGKSAWQLALWVFLWFVLGADRGHRLDLRSPLGQLIIHEQRSLRVGWDTGVNWDCGMIKLPKVLLNSQSACAISNGHSVSSCLSPGGAVLSFAFRTCKKRNILQTPCKFLP